MASKSKAENTGVATRDEIPADLVKREPWDENTLRGLTSWGDAMSLAQAEYGDVTVADSEIGDGFTVLTTDQKSRLIGVPMLLLSWTFNRGDMGLFVSIRVVTDEPGGHMGRYIVNDGSTGICEQLSQYTQRTGRTGGLMVKRGLRISEYEYEDPTTGEVRPAKTFYLDTSA